jgi:hypothetical protein
MPRPDIQYLLLLQRAKIACCRLLSVSSYSLIGMWFFGPMRICGNRTNFRPRCPACLCAGATPYSFAHCNNIFASDADIGLRLPLSFVGWTGVKGKLHLGTALWVPLMKGTIPYAIRYPHSLRQCLQPPDDFTCTLLPWS